jgi:membrane fusion protein, heavy metal efflux system
MNRFLVSSLLLAFLLAGCGESMPDNMTGETGHAHDAPGESEPRKGPHGGRLLTDGDFAVELAIFETGVPPEYRAWPSLAGKPVDPGQVRLGVELKRLGGVTDRIGFAPSGDFLRGDREIVEPHSFDVTVTAVHAGKTYRWTHPSHEGRVSIPAAVAQEAGIKTAVAGPGVIEETLRLYGAISPDLTRVREVKARFPGVIRSVRRQVGDRVSAGETLATVESNESLQTYAVTAPIAGVVTRRHAETGEQTDSEALFEVADFSRVWAEFSVFPRDRGRLREGQAVRVLADGGAEATGQISYVSPLSSRDSQSVTARVVLDNGDRRWTPGQFVEGRVTLAQTQASLVVPLSALQNFRDFTVVFAQFGDVYEVRMLELGRRDAERVEVLGGLAPGTVYVTENSYLIKADIEKSGASHDH